MRSGIPKGFLWGMIIVGAFFLGLKSRREVLAEVEEGPAVGGRVERPIVDLAKREPALESDGGSSRRESGELAEGRRELAQRVEAMKAVKQMVEIAGEDPDTAAEAARYVAEVGGWGALSAEGLWRVFSSYYGVAADEALAWLAGAPREKREQLNRRMAGRIHQWSRGSKGKSKIARDWIDSQRSSAFYDRMAHAYVAGTAKFDADAAREIAVTIGDEVLRERAITMVESGGGYYESMTSDERVSVTLDSE